jgi:hypothetical protein
MAVTSSEGLDPTPRIPSSQLGTWREGSRTDDSSLDSRARRTAGLRKMLSVCAGIQLALAEDEQRKRHLAGLVASDA